MLNIIPTNIFESLANGTMLQIILFALILGVILANMSDRADIVKNFFSQFNDINDLPEYSYIHPVSCITSCDRDNGRLYTS